MLDALIGHPVPGPLHAFFLRLHPAADRTGRWSLDAVRSLATTALAVEADASRPGAADRIGTPAFDRLATEAVIAAAKSDQRLDQAELDALATELDDTAMEPTDRTLLQGAVRRAPMLDHLTRDLRTRVETVALYAVSLLGTDRQTERSRHYLRMLAARLGLEQALTGRIEAAMGLHVTGASQP